MRIVPILTLLLAGCSSTLYSSRPGAGAGPCGFSHADERWTIELTDGSRVRARQVTIGVQDIVFRDEQGLDRSFPRAAVREVRNASTGRGALKGMGGGALATGAAFGLIGLMSGDDSPNQWFAMTAGQKGALGLVVGGALGAIVGLVAGIAGGDTEHCIVAGPAAYPTLPD